VRLEDLQVGIVGPGTIGTRHIEALRRLGINVAGVAASSLESARRHAHALGIERAYVSADELIHSNELDVVHICTPNGSHRTLCLTAIAAKKPFVCEKPLATSLRDAREIEAAASRSGVFGAVCYNHRYWPMIHFLRRSRADGELGQVHLVHGGFLLEEVLRISDEDHWMFDLERMGPSLTLADVGVHWWDLVEFTTGHKVSEAFCSKLSVRKPLVVESEDTAAILLRLDDGALASGVVCQAAAGYANLLWIELVGDAASARWTIERADELEIRRLATFKMVVERGSTPTAAILPPGSLPHVQPQGLNDAFCDLIRDIYSGILDHSLAGTFPTLHEGVHGLAVLQALLNSAREGCWMPVED
jgi:predicted dehydrogenase